MLIDHSLSTFVVGRLKDNKVQTLGTSFVVGNKFFTALHVINSDDKDLVIILPKILNINMYQDTTDLSCQTVRVKMASGDPIHDLCALTPVNGMFPPVDTWELGNLDDCNVGEELGLWGFPHCNEMKEELFLHSKELNLGLKY